MKGLPGFFADYQGRVSAEIGRLVNGGSPVERAMAYTATAPSKQVRAVLTILCAELCGGTAARAIPAAASIELVHASSLILDDLPAMVAKGGDRLLVEEAIATVKAELLRRAMVVTPNIPEAEVLADTTVRTVEDMTLSSGLAAARRSASWKMLGCGFMKP